MCVCISVCVCVYPIGSVSLDNADLPPLSGTQDLKNTIRYTVECGPPQDEMCI